MNDRTAFEAWYSASISESQGALMKHENGEYVYLATEWLCWQSATMAERERCATIIEENAKLSSGMCSEILRSQIVAIRKGS